MKREFLKELGIVDADVVNKIMAEYGKSVETLKTEKETLEKEKSEIDKKLQTATAEVTSYKDQITARDTSLKDMQTKLDEFKGVDVDKIKADLVNMQKANKDQQKLHDAALAKANKDYAISEMLLLSGAKNIKAVKSLIKDDIIAYEDGKLTGLKEQLEALKTSDGFLFKDADPNVDPKSPKPIVNPPKNDPPASVSDSMNTFFRSKG